MAVEGSDDLYLLDGDRKGGGVLHVLSLRDRSVVTTIPVGNGAKLGGVETGSKRLFVMSRGMPGSKGGVLHVVEGKDLVRSIDVSSKPELLRFNDERSRAFVIGNTSLSEVDLRSFTAGLAMQTPLDVGQGLEGRRAIAVFPDGEGWGRAVVVDLEKDEKLTNFMTGSKGGRWGRSLAAGALSVGSFVLARSAAEASGQSVFYYNIYAPRARGVARGPLALSSNGTHAYALDNMTNDVTAIDLNSGERVVDIDVGKGARELVVLGDQRTILAVSDAHLTLIDTQTNKMAKQIPLKGGVAGVSVSPDGSRIVITSKGEVTVLDGRSGPGPSAPRASR